MKRLLSKWKILALVMQMIALLFAGVPMVAAGAADDNCLTLEGTLHNANYEVAIGEAFSLLYTLMPGGSFTQTVNRDPVDIAFVIDISGSMNDPMTARTTKPTRMESLKEAANSLVNALKAIGLGDRVGIVTFDQDASQALGLTSNMTTVQNTINKLKANGSTNLGAGLKAASAMLAGSPQGRKQVVIALTDGASNYYLDAKGKAVSDKSQGYQLSRDYAKEQAKLIAAKGTPIYTIALGAAGSSDIDHQVLVDISSMSGGTKYDGTNASTLADVFLNITEQINKNGQIDHIQIVQPLPNSGFELAAGNSAGVKIVGNELIIDVPSIAYPYDVNSVRKAEVKLKQTTEIGLQKLENATVRYTNACGANKTGSITGSVDVNVMGWVDVWGNMYAGDASGAITRYKLGDLTKPQWTIHEKNVKATNVTFRNSALGVHDDAIVDIAYADGSKSTWDLRPSVPSIELRDADGALITNTAWHKGKAKFRVTGSANKLPATTVYHNNDFKNNADGGTYISGYKYRVNGGAWKTIAAGAVETLPNLGEGISIEAVALTESVSGQSANKVAGDIASKTTSLDETPPTVTLTVTASADRSEANPTFQVSVQDIESPIDRVILKIDGQAITVNGNGTQRSLTLTKKLSDYIASSSDRAKWIKVEIVALNKAGLANSEVAYGGVSGTEHYILVNPGLSGSLTSDGDYSIKASGTPVTVNALGIPTNRTIIENRLSECSTCLAVTLVEMTYTVSNPAIGTFEAPLGASTFKISSEGTNQVSLRLVDSLGEVHESAPITIKIDYKQKKY